MILIMGGSGGLGRAVREAMWYEETLDWSRDTGVDFLSTRSIAAAAEAIEEPIEGIINCAGVNALVPFDKVTWEGFAGVMRTNAYALPMVVQALRDRQLLQLGARICNVISNAAWVPMTHSLMYNASKAAQLAATRQMARELKQYSIFGVAPNKLKGTGMSLAIERRVRELRGWTEEEATRYQLAALPAGQETPPASCAAFIAALMNAVHHPYITGCIFPYGGP